MIIMMLIRFLFFLILSAVMILAAVVVGIFLTCKEYIKAVSVIWDNVMHLKGNKTPEEIINESASKGINETVNDTVNETAGDVLQSMQDENGKIEAKMDTSRLAIWYPYKGNKYWD